MIRKETIKSIIREFHTNKLPHPIKRDILLPAESNKIISLVGARRAGKTYLLFQKINELLEKGHTVEKILYINFEDERLELNKDELDLILQSYRELYPDIDISNVYIFFDEIQNIKGWERFVRRIYDTLSKNIYITGSNSKLLGEEIATSLRGRTLKYEVPTLSFKEFLRFNNLEYKVPIDFYSPEKKVKIKKYFKEYMIYGGFPEILFLEKELKIKTLQEYFEVMLYRDLAERYNIKDLYVLKYFLKRLIENSTKLVSINKIYNELKSEGFKIGKDTIYRFLDYAENSNVIKLLRKHYISLHKKEFGEKKVYPADNGFITALNFIGIENYGKLLENVVFHELSIRFKEIYYYRDKKECDFVIFNNKKPHLIQVSYALDDAETLKREIGGLTEACKYFKVDKADIITFDEYKDGGRLLKAEDITINVIPAWQFFLQV
jgi:predicted AAA+ superfamily ATPase